MRARSNQVRTSGVVPRSSAAALLLGLALATSGAGCNAGGSTGTSTGNPSDGSNTPSLPGGGDGRDIGMDRPGDLVGGEDGVGTAGGFCKADATKLDSTSAQTDLGFTADDLLAFAAGVHEEAIRWHDSNLAILGPEKGEHRVTIALSYDGGEIRLMTPSTAQSGGPEPAIGTPAVDLPAIGGVGGCMPWLEVDVRVTVKTDGGALDESFDATLRSRNALLGSVFVQPEPKELGGAFAPEQILQPDFELAQLDLQINFTPFGVSGTFNGVFEVRRGDTVGGAAGDKPFADFGRVGCGAHYGAFPVALGETVEGATGQDALDLVASASELSVTWNDGTSTTATLAFNATGSGACVLLDDYVYDGVTIMVDGQLELQSADGRVDALWDASVRAELPESGAIDQVKLSVERKGGSVPAGDDNGIPGADVSAYDDFYYTFMLAISRGAAGGAATGAMGELKVIGFEFAPCAGGDSQPPDRPADMPGEQGAAPSDPGSSGGGTAGCRGADMTDVLSGAFTLAP